MSVTLTGMSSKPPPPPKADDGADAPAKKGGKGKLILIAVPVVLLLLGAGLWFSGILPHLLGMDKHEEHARAEPPNQCLPPISIFRKWWRT